MGFQKIVTLLLGMYSLTFYQANALIQIGILTRKNDTAKRTAEVMLHYAEEVFEGDLKVNVERYDSNPIGLYEAVCRLAEKGVMAVVSWGSSGEVIREADILTQLHIPLISISATSPGLKSHTRDYLLRLAPSDTHQAEVIFDILRHFNWTRFSILSSNDDYGLQGLIKLQQLASLDVRFTIVTVQYFKASHTGKITSVDVKNELKAILDSLSTVVILNCHSAHGRSILQQAAEMSMLGFGYAWIATDSITAVSQNLAMDDGTYPDYLNGLIGTVPAIEITPGYRSFEQKFEESGRDKTILNIWSTTVYDALALAYNAHKQSDIESLKAHASERAYCTNRTVWKQGAEFMATLKATRFKGVTGSISFMDSGVINRTTYAVKNFFNGRFDEIGMWTKAIGLDMNHANDMHFLGGGHEAPSPRKNTLSGTRLRFGIIEDPPFAFKNRSKECLNNYGSAKCWYGLFIDLNNRFAKDVNFTYEFVESPDGRYGSFNPELARYTGLIHELMERNIAMATVPFTVNANRLGVVDFLGNIMNVRVTSVYVSNSYESTNPMFFLQPLSASVWIAILATMVFLSCTVTVLDYVSPLKKLINTVTLGELKILNNDSTAVIADARRGKSTSFYNNMFVVASGFVGREGGDGIPDSPAARVILIGWWFFTTIIISMYTANLTVFLTSTLERGSLKLNALTDILQERTFNWGLMEGSSTEIALRNMNMSDYHRVLKFAHAPKNGAEAFDLVRKGKFLFINEDIILEYQFRHDCNATLTYHDKNFPILGISYGIPKGTPYKDLLSERLLNYVETGYIQSLKLKWYAHDGKACTGQEVGTQRPFDLQSLYGIFVFLGVLFSFAVVMMVGEYLYKAYRIWKISELRLTYIGALLLVLKGKTLFLRKNYSNLLDSYNPITQLVNSSYNLVETTINVAGDSEDANKNCVQSRSTEV